MALASTCYEVGPPGCGWAWWGRHMMCPVLVEEVRPRNHKAGLSAEKPVLGRCCVWTANSSWDEEGGVWPRRPWGHSMGEVGRWGGSQGR